MKPWGEQENHRPQITPQERRSPPGRTQILWEARGEPCPSARAAAAGSASGNIRHHPPPAPPFPAKILTNRRNPEHKAWGGSPGPGRAPSLPQYPRVPPKMLSQSPSWEDVVAWGYSLPSRCPGSTPEWVSGTLTPYKSHWGYPNFLSPSARWERGLGGLHCGGLKPEQGQVTHRLRPMSPQILPSWRDAAPTPRLWPWPRPLRK